MAKLWVFGDSFCSYNENWISTLYNKGGFSEIEILGVAGSSLIYTLGELELNINNINQEDSVIIGLTNHHRHYFQNVHFQGPQAHYFDKKTKKYNPNVEENLLDAYKMFITYLMDKKQEVTINSIFKYYIDNSILPKLKSNNTVVFNTIYRADHSGFEYEGMYETVISFFHEYLGRTNMTSKDILKEIMGPNHWVDHPDYEDYFWNIYTKLFEPLWLN